MWRGEKPSDRYPFVYGELLFSYYDDVHSPEDRLRLSLDEIVVHGRLGDDYIPSQGP